MRRAETGDNEIFRKALEQSYFLDVFDTEEERKEEYKVCRRYADSFFANEVVDLPDDAEAVEALLVMHLSSCRDEIIGEVRQNIQFDV